MLTSKQRSNLIGISSNIEAIGQIGKGGITDNLKKSFSDALEKREIIKISVLENAPFTAKELAPELAAALNAQVVCQIGRKVVLYRRSQKEGIKHIEF